MSTSSTFSDVSSSEAAPECVSALLGFWGEWGDSKSIQDMRGKALYGKGGSLLVQLTDRWDQS
jgi:hypothetical protein